MYYKFFDLNIYEKEGEVIFRFGEDSIECNYLLITFASYYSNDIWNDREIYARSMTKENGGYTVVYPREILDTIVNWYTIDNDKILFNIFDLPIQLDEMEINVDILTSFIFIDICVDSKFKTLEDFIRNYFNDHLEIIDFSYFGRIDKFFENHYTPCVKIVFIDYEDTKRSINLMLKYIGSKNNLRVLCENFDDFIPFVNTLLAENSYYRNFINLFDKEFLYKFYNIL